MIGKIREWVAQAYLTLAGVRYDKPVVDVDFRQVGDDQLVESLRNAVGSDTVKVSVQYQKSPSFPWDRNPPVDDICIKDVLDYLVDVCFEKDLFPITRLRLQPVRQRRKPVEYLLVADTEMAVTHAPLTDVMSLQLAPVYKSR